MTLELILICIALVWLAGLTAWMLWLWKRYSEIRFDLSAMTTDSLRSIIRMNHIDENHRELRAIVSGINDAATIHSEHLMEAHEASETLLEEMEAES